LAGFSRVNGEGFAGKVLFAIFPALGPFGNFSNFVFGISPFKLALVVKQVLIFLIIKQVKVVLDLARFGGSPVRILGVLNVVSHGALLLRESLDECKEVDEWKGG
jgi:hypothetical protein